MAARHLFAVALSALLALPAMAEGRYTLGWGRLFSNDQIGDGRDRWQSGAYSVSRVRGTEWRGALPETFGDILEFRGHSAIVAPSSLTTPPAWDRRYAGLLSLGLHSHFGWQGNEVALGGDLVFTGAQTGVGAFHRWSHDLLGMTEPAPGVLGNQIGNAVHPTLVAEVGRTLSFGDTARLRPFAELRAGVETLVRVGGDLTIGPLGADDLLMRDAVTGQRYRAVEGSRSDGFSLTLGGDVAQVFDSALLPDGGAASLSDSRHRLRAGLHWQGKRTSTFYGVTYLSPEFDQQPTGQVVGSLSLNLRF